MTGAGTIEGVGVVELRRIPDERGTIYHMLRADDPHFISFGEIYFTSVYPGVVKGWHRHREMTLNYACILGRIKLVLYDDRPESSTVGTLQELFLGTDHYALVTIPPGIWTGFKGMTEPYALVANCCTHPHDPARTERLDPFDNQIPYDWAVRQH
jgi:dTDP-4-dehydrorhamnose 3,5-epimerase